MKYDIKNWFLSKITILIIVIAFLISLIIALSLNKNNLLKDRAQSSLNIIKNETITKDKLKNISIELYSQNLIIKESNDENIHVIHKNNRFDDDMPIDIKNDKESLQIKTKTNENDIVIEEISTINVVEVHIPKSYCENLFVSIKRGEFTIVDSLNLNKFSLDMKSIDFESEQYIHANILRVDSNSSKFNANKIEVNSINAKINSGNINIKELYGAGKVYLEYGDAHIEKLKFLGNFDCNIVNGNLKLGIDSESGQNLELTDSYGEIKSDFNLDYEDKSKTKATYLIDKSKKIMGRFNVTLGDIDLRKID